MKNKLMYIIILSAILLSSILISCENPWMKDILDDLINKKKGGNDGGEVPVYTVTFDSNGGTAVSPISNVASGSKISAPAPPTKGSYGTLGGWYKDAGFTNAWNFATDTVTSNIALYAKWNASYSLGDTGPGGGKIFYRLEAGFTMTDDSTTAYYLEAAPTDMPSDLDWATLEYTSSNINGTETAIGTGRKNTALILATDANAPAAKACVAPYNAGGTKTDWFLPSKDELNELYSGRTHVGNMSIDWYWSSSQYSNNYAWVQRFSEGDQAIYSKNNTISVRAVRAF